MIFSLRKNVCFCENITLSIGDAGCAFYVEVLIET